MLISRSAITLFNIKNGNKLAKPTSKFINSFKHDYLIKSIVLSRCMSSKSTDDLTNKTNQDATKDTSKDKLLLATTPVLKGKFLLSFNLL